MELKYPKWRELLIEPKDINFKNIKYKKIVNYLPAGNDVLECVVDYNEKDHNVYIKIERSKMACFDIENEHISILLNENYYEKVPKIIESGLVFDKRYIVLDKIFGYRLSEIIDTCNDKDRELYIYKYGAELGKIHQIPITNFGIAKQRVINDYPRGENYSNIPSIIKRYISYLKDNKPEINLDTFIHGDFHYANILWDNKEISGVLDFEYSGVGFREQDIAWALVLRPGQKFMDNINDIKSFLSGYAESSIYDKNKLKWCLINGYCHFYLMNLNNKLYLDKIKSLLEIVYSL